MVPWRRVLGIALGVVVAAVGVCLVVCAAPLVAAGAGMGLLWSSVGGGLLAGGSAVVSNLINNPDIGTLDLMKEFGINFAVGAVTGLFSSGAQLLVSHLGLGALAGMAVRAVSTFLAAPIGQITSNWLRGRPLLDQMKAAIFRGLVSSVLVFGFDMWNYQNVNSMISKVFSGVPSLKATFQQFKSVLASSWLVRQAVDFASFAIVDCGVQWVTTGKINWKLLAMGAILYGGQKMARAGYQYYKGRDSPEYKQTQKNEELVDETVKNLEKETKDVNDVLQKANPGGRKSKLNTEALTTMRNDKTGETEYGVNYSQRKNEINAKQLEEPGQRNIDPNAGIDHDNPVIKDQKVGYHNPAGTNKETKQIVLTNNERLEHPNRNQLQGRGCAEVDAASKLARSGNLEKIEDVTAVTVGRRWDENTQEYQEKFIPPCERACASWPVQTLSTRENMATHLQNQAQYYRDIDLSTRAAAGVLQDDQISKSRARKEKSSSKLEKRVGAATSSKLGMTQAATSLRDTGDDNPYNSDSEDNLQTSPTSFSKVHYKDVLPSFESSLIFEGECSRAKNDECISHEETVCQSGQVVVEQRIGEVQECEPVPFQGKKQRRPPNKGENNDENNEVSVIQSLKSAGKKLKGGVKNLLNTSSKLPVAQIFSLIGWSKEEDSYVLMNPYKWPEFPRNLRIIGVIGPQSSGKTSLIHSLVYAEGYAIEKDMYLHSKLRLGVLMYLLPEKGIAFIDCCDGMGSIDENKPDGLPPLGSAINELFTYLTCDHMILNLAVHEKDISADICDKAVYSRFQLLAAWSMSVNMIGASNITVLLRSHESIRNSTILKQLMADYSRTEEPPSEENFAESVDDQKQAGNSSDQEAILKRMHHTVVMPLRFKKLDRSIVEDKQYESEFDVFIARVREDTNSHLSTIMSEQDAGKFSCFRYQCLFVWQTITSADHITKSLTDTANEKMRKSDDTGLSDAVKSYFDDFIQLLNFLIESGRCYTLRSSMERFMEWSKNEGEKLKLKDEKKKNSLLLIESLLKSGHLLMEKAENCTDKEIELKAIQLGLRGVSVILRYDTDESPTTFLVLKMLTVEYNVIPILSKPSFHRHHEICWYLLAKLASAGLRSKLLPFDVMASVQATERSEFVGYQKDIYCSALHFLATMMQPIKEEDTPEPFAAEIEIKKIQYHKDNSEWMKNLVELSMRNLADPSGKIAQQPKLWLAHKREIEAEENGAIMEPIDPEQDKKLLQELSNINRKMLNEAIAIHLACAVFQSSDQYMSLENLSAYAKWHKDPVRLRLQIWIRVVDWAGHDSQLFLEILRERLGNENLLAWLRNNFIVDKRQFPIQVLTVLSHLMHAESRQPENVRTQVAEMFGNNKQRKQKINTLDEAKRRETREKLIRKWGYVTLNLLENNCLRPVLAFLTEEFQLRSGKVHDAIELLCYLRHLLCFSHEEEELKLSLSIFIVARANLIRKIREMLVSVATDLNNHAEAEKREPGTSILSKKAVHQRLQLISDSYSVINRLMYYAFAHNSSMRFFEEADELSVQNTEIWNDLMLANVAVYKCVLGSRSLSTIMGAASFMQLTVNFLAHLFNLAAKSKIGFATVLHRENPKRVMRINDLDEPENVPVITGIGDILKLKLRDEKGFDCKNVKRISHILSMCDEELVYTIINGSLQAAFRRVMEFTRQQQEHRASLENIKRRAETPRVLGFVGGPQKSNATEKRIQSRLIPSNTSHSAPTIPDVACEGVFVDNCIVGLRIPKHAFNSKLESVLREIMGDLEAVTILLLLRNRNRREQISELKTYFVQLTHKVDAHPLADDDNRFWFQSLDRFSELDYGMELLWRLGLENQIENGKEVTCNNLESARNNLTDIKCCFNLLESADLDLYRCTLNSCFEPTVCHSEETLLQQFLPEDFFGVTKDNQTDLTKTTISQLIEMKKRGGNVDSNYILVRVETENKEMYQAVFSIEANVRTVLQNLSVIEPSVSCVFHHGKPLNEEVVLKNIAKFAMYATTR